MTEPPERLWLIDARKRRGLNQEKLAEKVRVHPVTISRWERGTQEISLRHHDLLAKALGVSVDDLIQYEAAYQQSRMEPSAPVAAEPGGLESELWHTSGRAENLARIIDELETIALTSTGAARRRLLRLLGYTHQTLGENAFDQLRFVAAAGHFQQMQELGFEIDDPDLLTLAFTHQADVARRRRRYSTASRLFAAGETHASTANPATQARRWQTMARTHAERGERPQFLATIDLAEQCAYEESEDVAPVAIVDPISVRHERAHGLTLLGSPVDALTIYERTTPTTASGRDRTNFTIIKAQALAHAGHLDEGIRLAITGLTEARAFGSARFVSRVQRFYDRLLARHPAGDRRMVELHEALAA